MILRIFLVCLCCFSLQGAIKRDVLALYDSEDKVVKNIRNTATHVSLEVVLNYLGVNVVYHDLKYGLPNLDYYPDCIGILTCFHTDTVMAEPEAFLQWAQEAIDRGLKYVILEQLGYHRSLFGNYTETYKMNQLHQKIGFSIANKFIDRTFDFTLTYANSDFYPFERELPSILPPFPLVKLTSPEAKALLTVENPSNKEQVSTLAMVSDKGGYIAQEFAASYLTPSEQQSPEEIFWYINPFYFFTLAFDLQQLPIPDITTLAGRRIYYSHIDGDSLNSVSDLEREGLNRKICGEIIYEKVLAAYPYLPVTVSFVGADINPKWVAIKESRPTAEKMIALKNVELGTHTYSHPFLWSFFNRADPNHYEKDFLYLYPYGGWDTSFLSWMRATYQRSFGNLVIMETGELYGYTIPRAYANEPFNLNLEIEGSIKEIESIATNKKKVKIVQWSGDCSPWDTPLEYCVQAGVLNINGGQVRLDPESPSLIGVSPIGISVGGYRQIYTSADNENLYTFLWKDRFYGFQYVTETWDNTEKPRRLKPVNLYYHFYSGEKLASLNALIHNLTYVESHPLIPIWTSRYAEIANGFYSIRFEQINPYTFEVHDRLGLQTIRFDAPFYEAMHVDYEQSKGVIGHTFYLNNLYVYLDADVQVPVISLSKNTSSNYLIESRWEIRNLQKNAQELTFETWGFGPLEMTWDLTPGTYQLQIKKENGETHQTSIHVKEDRLAVIKDLPVQSQEFIQFSIKK